MSINKLEDTLLQLDKIVMSVDITKLPVGLFDGKMGLCIYFFHLARNRNCSKYQNFAEKLLKDIYISVDIVSSLDFRTGISGIAWGIHYLAENKFVTANIDGVLQEVDDILFRIIHSDWLNDETKKRIDFLWLLFYYSDRLRTKKNTTEIELTQKMVILLINYIETNFAEIPWEPPILFNLESYELALYTYLLSRFYSYDFYNYKINKIWDNISNVILSSIPTRHANRLILLFAIQNVLKYKSIPEWEHHAILLEKNINHETIIDQEFSNKNITLRRGISGYCLLLAMLNGDSLSSNLKARVLEKLKLSDIWDGRFNPLSESIGGSIGLSSGYSGVSLVYHNLLKSI